MVSDSRSNGRLLIAIVFMGLLIRGCFCVIDLSSFAADPDAYRAIAETLARTGVYGLTDAAGEGQPTAFRPPLYPYLLSWMTVGGRLHGAAVAAFHTLLGTLTVVLTFLAAQRLLGHPSDRPAPLAEKRSPIASNVARNAASVVAALLVAVDPILVQQSTLVMTETLATLLATAVLWHWSRSHDQLSPWSALGLGSLFALAFLCRPTFLVWAGLFSIALVVLHPSGRALRFPSRDRFHTAATIGLLMLATVGSWTVRNARSIGHPVWATTHGGYTLLLGNNPSFYEYLRVGEFGVAWDPKEFFEAYSHRYDGDPTEEAFWNKEWGSNATIVRRVSEREDDQLTYKAARATIDRQPRQFIWSCFVRLGRLWTPLPHRTPERSWPMVAALAGYYVLFYGAVAIGLWRLGREALSSRWWPIWTLAITLSLVHAVYWSNMRMRAPIIPGLAVLAVAAWAHRPPRPTTDR